MDLLNFPHSKSLLSSLGRKGDVAARGGKQQALAAVQDALQGDEFRRNRNPYQVLKTVTPVFTEELTQWIEAAILRYEAQANAPRIPPAYRYSKAGLPEPWHTNKHERLAAILWIFSQLPPVQSQTEAINQMACVIHQVELLAQKRYQASPRLYLPDPRPMRLPEPLPETVEQQRILVSYGTRHVTLFKADGAVQIQGLPERPEKVDYLTRAKIPGLVLLTKPGILNSVFWKS